jgi:hypothetical protein
LKEYTFDLKIKKVYTESDIINASSYFETIKEDLYKNEKYYYDAELDDNTFDTFITTIMK